MKTTKQITAAIEIEKYNPCEDALEFRKQFSSFKDAWESCQRGDWMLWIAKKVGVDLKLLTKVKTKCALTVRHLMRDERSINACEIALKFSDGQATREELDAAYAAAADAAADAAAAYADADAYAAYAAAAAAAYADAAAYAADAADAAAADAARKKNQLETANICRDMLTDEILKLIQS